MGDSELSGDGPASSSAIEPFAAPPSSLAGVAEAIGNGELVMWCDSPVLDGTDVAEGFLTVRGWAHAEEGVDRVLVYLDGACRAARLGIPRSDLRAQFGRSLTNAGFQLTIKLDPAQSGRLDVAVVARGMDGHAVGMRGKVEGRPGERSDTSRSDVQERYVPDETGLTVMASEHEARYRWATEAVRSGEVLDAGCGAGYGTAMLADAGAARAIGVDISADAISIAQARYSDPAEFLVGDLLALPFRDQSFDVVVCFEAIEHVTDAERALDELRRVLRATGLLLISSPNRDVYEPGNTFHIHEFTPEELRETLARRFSEVRLYRQQSHCFTLICDDDTFTRTWHSEDLPARFRKSTAQRPGEELYTLALAGAEPLPELNSIALVGGPFDARDWHDLAFSWQEHVRVAEASAATLAAEVDRLERRLADLAGRTQHGLAASARLLAFYGSVKRELRRRWR